MKVVKYFVVLLSRHSIKIRNYYLDWGILGGTPVGLLVINFIFQRVFRINSDVPFPVNFTSRIIMGNKIVIAGKGTNTVHSFSVSGGCYIQAINGIILGDGIRFAPGVKIISANHDLSDINKSVKAPPVKIGNHVWIGANVVILPGVEIADNCVVGAGSVVTKSVNEKNSVLVGNPARVIRKIKQ